MADELETLKQEVAQLKRRVDKLEGTKEPDVPQKQQPTKQPTRAPDTSGNALGWIGGGVLTLGLVFLIAYAIDQGWISRAAQILLGVGAGAAIAAAGHALHKKMDLQGSLVTATGIVVAYFSIYSGYIFEAYRQATGFSLPAASALLLLTVLAAGWLSTKQQSPVLLTQALALTFVTTLLSPLGWLSVIYTALLLAGFCALVYKEHWTTSAFIGGAITAVFTAINIIRGTDAQAYTMLGVFGTLFLALSLARSNALAGTATIVATWALALLAAQNNYDVLTLAAAALSLALYAQNASAKRQEPTYLIAGIGLLTLWVPLQFSGLAVTSAWTLIAALLGYAHTKNDTDWLAATAGISGGLAAAATALQSTISYSTPETLTSLGLLAAAALFVSYHYAIPNKQQAHPYYIAGVAALALLVALELTKAWITVAWGALAFISLLLGLQTARPVPRTTGLVLIALTLAKLFLVDTTTLSPGLRIIAYIALGAILLVGSVAYRKYLRD